MRPKFGASAQSELKALEKLYAANLTPILGELGAHYEQAGQPTPAIYYYQQAAAHARAIYSHVELVHYLNKQLAMLRRLPNREALAGEEIDLLLDLGLAYIFTDGFGSKPVGETWQHAHELAKQAGSNFQPCRVLLGLDMYFNNQGAIRTARAYSEQNFVLAQQETDVFLRQQVLGNYGAILYHAGEINKSLPYFEEMLALHKPDHPPSFHWIHRDVSTNALVRSAKTLWFLGYPDQARARCDKAVQIARNDFDLFTLTAALDFSGMVYNFCRQYQAVNALGQQLIELATKYEFPHYLMTGKLYVCWSMAQQGQSCDNVDVAQEVIDFLISNQKTINSPLNATPCGQKF